MECDKFSIAAMLALSLCLYGCGKSDDSSSSTPSTTPAGAASASDDLLNGKVRSIVGDWQLDRAASFAANLKNAKLPGGVGYEIKVDGSGLRRIGATPAEPITWKIITASGDSIRLSINAVRSSSPPSAMDITVEAPDRLRITDIGGTAILARAPGGIASPQTAFVPEAATLTFTGAFDVSPETPSGLAVSRDGTCVISRQTAPSGGSLARWDMESRKAVYRMSLGGAVNTSAPVAVSADGKFVATADASGPTLWDAHTGHRVRSFAFRPGQGGAPAALLLNGDGSLLIIAASTQLIGWETDTGEQRFVLKVDNAGITAAAMVPSVRRIATGGSDNLIHIWSLPDGALVKTLDPQQPTRPTAIAISEDGQRLACAHLLGKIAVFDLVGSTLLRTIDPHDPRIDRMIFLSDAKSLVHPTHGATWDLAVTDVETGEMREVLKGHTAPVTSLILSADGFTLFSASEDHSIKFWDLSTINN